MNVALPAFIVFALLVPGFIFRGRFKRAERTSLDYSPFGRVATEGILWSAVLHAVWNVLAYWVRGLHVDFALLLGLLSSNPTQHGQAVEQVGNQARFIGEYFGSLYLAAFAVPGAIRNAISYFGFDREGHFLSPFVRFNDAPWYYLLTAADYDPQERPDLILVTAIIDVGGEPILFKGVLNDSFFNPDGELDRLILEFVKRRSLRRDEVSPSEIDDRWYMVAGHFFVVRYSDVITLNVEYVKLTATEAVGPTVDHSGAIADALSRGDLSDKDAQQITSN